MSVPELTLHEYKHEKHSNLLPSFVDVHVDCMEKDSTVAFFLPPFDKGRILKWWQQQAEETLSNDRVIIFMLASVPNSGKEKLAGCVMLYKPFSETEPWRGDVLKLLVSPNFRRLGIAKALMGRLEQIAEREGRTLLWLDTETGSGAESVYPKFGYIELGKIPRYSISPVGGPLRTETFFYKMLPSHPQ